jgi:hypothetical protein
MNPDGFLPHYSMPELLNDFGAWVATLVNKTFNLDILPFEGLMVVFSSIVIFVSSCIWLYMSVGWKEQNKHVAYRPGKVSSLSSRIGH